MKVRIAGWPAWAWLAATGGGLAFGLWWFRRKKSAGAAAPGAPATPATGPAFSQQQELQDFGIFQSLTQAQQGSDVQFLTEMASLFGGGGSSSSGGPGTITGSGGGGPGGGGAATPSPIATPPIVAAAPPATGPTPTPSSYGPPAGVSAAQYTPSNVVQPAATAPAGYTGPVYYGAPAGPVNVASLVPTEGGGEASTSYLSSFGL